MAMSPFRRLRLIQRLQFALERQFVKGVAFQLLVVAGLIGLISLVGGALVLPVAEDAGHLGEAVWWAFLRLSDPGYLGDDQGVWRRIVSTLLTVAGYVVFLGALVAILTQWLVARMRQLESGLTPVATRNHIVVLGWTDRTLPVVGEILQSEGRVRRFLERQHASKLRLVVLSEEVSARHAQALRDDPAIGRRARHIVLRSGNPLVMDDLERVDPLNAAAVIVPSGGAGTSMSADMATVKTLLSLSSHPRAAFGRLPYVVAEIQDHRKITVAQRAYRGPLEVVSGNSLVSRLMALNLRHRGLSRVFTELLSYKVGCGIFVREAGVLAGTTLGEAAARYRRAVLCGAVRWREGEFVPHLNPGPDFLFEDDDRLVFVAPTYADTQPGPASSEAAAAAPVSLPVERAADGVGGTRRVLVLGWNAKVVELLHELGSYRDERFDVTVVSVVSARARELTLEDEGGMAGVICRHVEADYAVEAELRALEPAAFDNVLLASSDRLASGEEADTRAVVAYLLLEALLDGAAAAPDLLLELKDPDNAPLLGGRRAEVLVSPLIVAHVVAQVALRRELRAVFDSLFTSGGPEFAFCSPGRYGGGDGATFHELAARVRSHGDTLIGVYRAAGQQLSLSPPGEEPLQLSDGASLVVMTNLVSMGAA